MRKIKRLWYNDLFWEAVGYVCLALCIFGQITVGYIYLVAQFAYLLANAASVLRNFALDLPKANKVKDITFTAITITLIILYFIRMG